jgi:single-strand DNA-binding protein
MLRASVIGNLGGDPELKYTEGGTTRLQFNVASNYRVKNEVGNWDDATEWVRVTVFGKRAETLSGILKKGTKVYVDGRLEARPWTDNRGQVRAGLEVIGDTVEFMSPRSEQQPATTDAQVSEGEDRDELPDLPF